MHFREVYMKTNIVSKLSHIPKDQLQMLLDTSNTLTDVLVKIGYKKQGGFRKRLNERIIQENLDLTKFKENNTIWKKTRLPINNKVIMLSTYLIENSTISRTALKKRLIKEKIIDYQCAVCGLSNEYNGKVLSLQLEHINGIPNDNRLENLCFLCPNCHSQTSTYCGRNVKVEPKEKAIILCKSCQKPKNTNRDLCLSCSGLKNRKFNATKEELEKLITQMPLGKVGEIYKVTDNAIKKRCIKLGIKLPYFGRGYWTRKNYETQ
jgi:transcription elongation factor Elf1